MHSLAQDFTTQAALYTHHQYIAGFIMCGAFAHGAIFFIRDYDPVVKSRKCSCTYVRT
jgi:photosystem I P700 chlorophyll a apoprotein A2